MRQLTVINCQISEAKGTTWSGFETTPSILDLDALRLWSNVNESSTFWSSVSFRKLLPMMSIVWHCHLQCQNVKRISNMLASKKLMVIVY